MPIDATRPSSANRIWHPYTRRSAADAGLPCIVRGEGIHLIDAEGRRYVDAISSWWCCALGHGHPRIVGAIRRQAGELQHSILGNLAHPRALELAERLSALMPDPRCRVLFASDGASAVEQALKIAAQYHHNEGRAGRWLFASIEGAYHGDTFGAMAMGYLDHFHRPFRPLLMPALRLPFPACAAPAGAAPATPCPCFAPARALLDARADELAGVVVEPLVLGAAGMRMYPPCWLRALAGWCRTRGVPLIADEIATGFGRTGTMFAFEQADAAPDIVCAGKALSAGYLPISATIVRDGIYDAFRDGPGDRTLQHGHTFCGNPIAAAAALEALKVYEEMEIARVSASCGRAMRKAAAPLEGHARVREIRSLGSLLAVELHPDPPGAPAPRTTQRVRERLMREGILLRPLGDVLYLMPPMVIADEPLGALVRSLVAAICAEAEA